MMHRTTNIWAEVSLFHICSFPGDPEAGAHSKSKLMHRNFMIDNLSSIHIYFPLLNIQNFINS